MNNDKLNPGSAGKTLPVPGLSEVLTTLPGDEQPIQIGDYAVLLTYPRGEQKESVEIRDASDALVEAVHYKDWMLGAKILMEALGQSTEAYAWFVIWSKQGVAWRGEEWSEAAQDACAVRWEGLKMAYNPKVAPELYLPSIGSRWQHVNGYTYVVESLPYSTDDREHSVVHRGEHDGALHIRTLSNFAGLHAKGKKRFTELDPVPPTLQERFHAGDVDVFEALELLAANPNVRKTLADHIAEDFVTIEEARAMLDNIHEEGRRLQSLIHGLNVAAGWWSDLETGEPKERKDGELCALIHSEISEGFEGVRKNMKDDHLGGKPMFECELADATIRINDTAGGRGFDLFGTLLLKLAYNQVRQDHTLSARRGENGKKC